MPEVPSIVYWDSCLFLAYVNEEPNRVEVVSTLLESSAAGELTIYTSDLSRVEVSFSVNEREQGSLNPEVEAQIASLWDGEVADMVEFNVGIAELASTLIRESVARGRSLKPYDATHLATAQWLRNNAVGIDQFHTYDDNLDWLNGTGLVGFHICRPYTANPRLLQ